MVADCASVTASQAPLLPWDGVSSPGLLSAWRRQPMTTSLHRRLLPDAFFVKLRSDGLGLLPSLCFTTAMQPRSCSGPVL